MRTSLGFGVLLALAWVSAVAQQQAPRAIQRDVKTVAPMYVAFVERTTTADQIPDQAGDTLSELWTTCEDNGFHPVNMGVIVLALTELPGPGEQFTWEAWLPVIEQPSERDLHEDAVVRIKRVPKTEVAFTYHVGDPNDVENTFMTLVQWAEGKQLPATGRVRVVLVGLTGLDFGEFVAECQLELGG
jgi:effector-binding domain-containing protein